MNHVIIGVDPHKPSATIEVVDDREKMLGSGRSPPTGPAGYAAMPSYVKTWPERVMGPAQLIRSDSVKPVLVTHATTVAPTPRSYDCPPSPRAVSERATTTVLFHPPE